MQARMRSANGAEEGLVPLRIVDREHVEIGWASRMVRYQMEDHEMWSTYDEYEDRWEDLTNSQMARTINDAATI